MTDLNDYRVRKAAARAYHPSVRPIWTPQDAIDTAQAFHAELEHAEIGAAYREKKPHWTAKLFGRSRFRRAKVYDGLAVTLLMALMACLGVVVFAASAKADPDGASMAYAAEYGPAVCSVLDDGHDTIAGLTGIGLAIIDDGLSAEQAGEVLAMSIYRICPRYIGLLERYIAIYGDQPGQVA